MPYVFGLAPAQALFRDSKNDEVKPLIVEHLKALELVPTEPLVAVIKDLCDNFYRSRPLNESGYARVRKASISDLRQQRELYRRIHQGQGERCAVCGVRFSSGPAEETLDHVIPWRLGGDPPGGWNWQLLCRRCNHAKDTWLAAYSVPENQNWIYKEIAQMTSLGSGDVGERGRYLVLRHFGKCQEKGCDATPKSSELRVVRNSPLGLPVFDHLTVRCVKHADAAGIVKS